MTAVALEPDVTSLVMSGGMAGFPDAQSFALVEVPQASPLFLLRSLDQPGLEFVVVPPGIFFPDYMQALRADIARCKDLGDLPAGMRAPAVLTRRSQQSIMIGKDIVITILEVRGDQVRIGVSAPRDVDVHREEVFLELQEANRSAASPSAEALTALGSLLPKAEPETDER